MNPTNKLRFVERKITTPINEHVAEIKIVKILQQWWENEPSRYDDVDFFGEWRDVPIEVEE